MPELTSIHRLLELARLARSQDLDEVLGAVARCVCDTLGYGTVVINLRRPAWDDFEVVHVEGPEEARAQLLGIRDGWDYWQRLLQPRFERRGVFVVEQGQFDWDSDDDGKSYVPDLEVSDDPRAWHPEDAVFVPLTDGDELLGTLCVDEPVSGMRPTDDELDALVAVASHAATALAHAKAEVEAARLRTALSDLLQISTRIGTTHSLDDALQEVCCAVARGLGFERAAVLLAGPDGDGLAHRASIGFGDAVVEAMPKLRLSRLQALFDPRYEHEGCQLLTPDEAEGCVPADQYIYDSTRNGRGPRAWAGHWLIAPLRDGAGKVIGFLWPDDPEDRLLPDADRLRALRLFADQAAAAISAHQHVAHLRHLAHHDPLTGVLNRRTLSERLDAELAAGGPVAVVFADLDRFKWVNDELGHDVGDTVLRRFGAVLRQHAMTAGGLAFRLGGEEFCLVLPRHDEARAAVAAEALRAASAATLGLQVTGLTVSVGVATSSQSLPDAKSLLRSADQALYAAKRLGRNRVVSYDPALPAVDRRTPADAEASSSATLSAVLLLASALDLRDASTAAHARTVARYAELTAQALGLDRERVERVRTAGALHDIGKIAVPDAILGKDGALSDEEWDEIKRHPEVGAQILAHAGLDDVAEWVLRHHERIDGRGYPDGLAGEAIPLEARILSVCDSYEAMTADRPYRGALPAGVAREELLSCAGTQFDPRVVDALLAVLAVDGELRTEEVAAA